MQLSLVSVAACLLASAVAAPVPAHGVSFGRGNLGAAAHNPGNVGGAGNSWMSLPMERYPPPEDSKPHDRISNRLGGFIDRLRGFKSS